MNPEQLAVWAADGDDRFPVVLLVSTTPTCSVLARSERWPDVSGSGADLFEALAAVRASLEQSGVVLECNGSRVDVYPSAALRQATQGRKAYVLPLPRTRDRPEIVDILEPCAPSSELGTVTEQRARFDAWLPEGPET